MKQKKINKHLYSAMIDTLGKIQRTQHPVGQIPLREIRLHLVDEDGEGIGLWIEYNEETGEFERGFLPLDAEGQAHEITPEEEFEVTSELEDPDKPYKGLLN